jgi:hypothetical protein
MPALALRDVGRPILGQDRHELRRRQNGSRTPQNSRFKTFDIDLDQRGNKAPVKRAWSKVCIETSRSELLSLAGALGLRPY